MKHLMRKLRIEDKDITEYALVFAVVLIVVMGTIRLLGSN